MNILIGDIEADSLKPSVIHMIGVIDYATSKYNSYVGDNVAEGILRLHAADRLVGHHILGFDIPTMENLTDGLVKFDRSKVIDTLPWSRKLIPGLPNYKLETFGKMLGLPKLDFKLFEAYSEEMNVYCERDCRINERLFQYLVFLAERDAEHNS